MVSHYPPWPGLKNIACPIAMSNANDKVSLMFNYAINALNGPSTDKKETRTLKNLF